MSDPITSTAEATKAVAETTGQAIEASREAGGYLTRIFGGSIEDAATVLRSHTSLWRIENTIRFLEKVEKRLGSIKNPAIRNEIAARIAIPLLEAASEETDPGIEELWVNYLCNGLTAPGGGFIAKHLTETLRRFEPDDVRVLPLLYRALLEDPANEGFVTLKLSDVQTRSGLEERAVQASIQRFESIGILSRQLETRGDLLTGRSTRTNDDYRILEIETNFGNFQQTSLLIMLGEAVLPAASSEPLNKSKRSNDAKP